jgi:hypothetical protein
VVNPVVRRRVEHVAQRAEAAEQLKQ